jgi:hypothetical protein
MNKPLIDAYQFGKITIGGNTYTKDVIITSSDVLSPWWRDQGHSLLADDLTGVLSQPPQILIIGTGTSGLMRVPQKTISQLESYQIQIIIQKTDKACQTYNELSKDHHVFAALHLTC